MKLLFARHYQTIAQGVGLMKGNKLGYCHSYLNFKSSHAFCLQCRTYQHHRVEGKQGSMERPTQLSFVRQNTKVEIFREGVQQSA